jgi:hypothetical protein
VTKAGTLTLIDNDKPPPAPKPPRRPSCGPYMRDRIGVNLKSAKDGLRYFGLRKLITGTGRGGLFTYLCGDGGDSQTRGRRGRQGRAERRLRRFREGAWAGEAEAHAQSRPAARPLQSHAESVTVTLFDSNGKSLSRTRTVTVTAAGRSG